MTGIIYHMLRWLYPKNRDYSFTLWDFFVSLTLLAVYVAGYRLLLLVNSWGHTFGLVYQYPEDITFESTETQYVFRAQNPQQLFVVIYQLQNRKQGMATFQRIVVPLPPMTKGILYFTTTLNYTIVPEKNELRFNDEVIAMVKLESLRKEPEFGELTGKITSGIFNDWRKCLLDSNQLRGLPNGDPYIPFADNYYVVHIMNEKVLNAAPPQISIPIPPSLSMP